MTDRDDRRQLAEHGTRPVTLPPSALLRTAAKDIKRRAHNKAVLIAEDGRRTDAYKRYAFFADHVRTAKTPEDVIRKALKAVESPAFLEKMKRRGDPNVWYLYDVAALRGALEGRDVVEQSVA